MAAKIISLVTGANSGIGYATVKLLASQPQYHTIMACRSIENAKRARMELEDAGVKGSISLLELDVRNDASIAAAAESVRQEFGRVDAFISNAGIAARTSGVTPRESFASILDTNVIGAFLVTEAFAPLLLESKKPYLIHLSSGLGSLGLASDPTNPIYQAPWDEYRISKSALNMAVLQQHKRYQSKNLRIFAFCPGLVRSRLRGESADAISAGGNAGDPAVSAEGLLRIVEGHRDAEAGQFLTATGQWPW